VALFLFELIVVATCEIEFVVDQRTARFDLERSVGGIVVGSFAIVVAGVE